MSGALSNVMSNEDATAVGRMFCEKAGTPFDAEALRGLTAEQLLNVQAQLPGAMPYQPCVDGELIPDLPLQTLATGVVCLKSKQVMLGCTAREFNLFSPFNVSLRRKPLEDVLKKSVADLGSKRMALASSVEEQSSLEAELRDLLKRVRMARGTPNWTEVEKEFSNMMVFVVPSRLAAQQLAKSAGAVFLYSIDFDAGRLGAAHAFELPLLFGVHTKNRVLKELSGAWREPQAAEALSRSMMTCFSAFARVGAPTPQDADVGEAAALPRGDRGDALTALPQWPAYKPDSDPSVFVFDRECRVVKEAPSSVLNQAVAFFGRARRPFGVVVGATPSSRL
mmetsp:Transcript_33558/g.95052  ORF Transcript_33558/g.95052 Transcript_33558/m.95052 type:complete len:337 (+) Transcript_33558:785-1795(+)